MKLARDSAASRGWDLDVIFVRDPMATRFGIMPCDDFSYRIYGRRRVLKGLGRRSSHRTSQACGGRRRHPSAAYQMIQTRLTLAAHLFVMAVRTFL